jgi:hypothetical protein
LNDDGVAALRPKPRDTVGPRTVPIAVVEWDADKDRRGLSKADWGMNVCGERYAVACLKRRVSRRSNGVLSLPNICRQE